MRPSPSAIDVASVRSSRRERFNVKLQESLDAKAQLVKGGVALGGHDFRVDITAMPNSAVLHLVQLDDTGGHECCYSPQYRLHTVEDQSFLERIDLQQTIDSRAPSWFRACMSRSHCSTRLCFVTISSLSSTVRQDLK
jgi:hypothetical protein